MKLGRHTDEQNNVKSRCEDILGIFTDEFIFLSYIAAEKITFPVMRYRLTDCKDGQTDRQSDF